MPPRVLDTRLGHSRGDIAAHHPAAASVIMHSDSQSGHEAPVDPFGQVAELIGAIFELGRTAKELLAAIAGQSETWFPMPAVSNVAGTQVGASSQCFVTCWPRIESFGIDLRNILVGSSAAGTLQLLATKADATIMATAIPPQSRVIQTLRTAANNLTLVAPTGVTLDPGERLYLVCISASGLSLDFSAEYRMRD